MKSSLLLILALTVFSMQSAAQSSGDFDSFSQIILKNQEILKNETTNQTSNEIDSLLPGRWVFTKAILPIYKQIHFLDSINLYTDSSALLQLEVNQQKNIIFDSNHNYRYENPESIKSAGKWHYNDSNKLLQLSLDKPIYLIDSMVAKSMNMKPITGENLRIYSLNQDTLLLMQFYFINEIEQWYYLLEYERMDSK